MIWGIFNFRPTNMRRTLFWNMVPRELYNFINDKYSGTALDKLKWVFNLAKNLFSILFATNCWNWVHRRFHTYQKIQNKESCSYPLSPSAGILNFVPLVLVSSFYSTNKFMHTWAYVGVYEHILTFGLHLFYPHTKFHTPDYLKFYHYLVDDTY